MTARAVLTPHRQRILTMHLVGHSNKEIAAELGTTLSTVGNVLFAVKMRLGLYSRAELFRWAWERGLIQEHMTAPLASERGEAEGREAA